MGEVEATREKVMKQSVIRLLRRPGGWIINHAQMRGWSWVSSFSLTGERKQMRQIQADL